MRVCKVLKCEPVKKSDKLLCFTLDDGSGTDRQILSGIAKYYRPEELVGKTVVAILNLPPRKMMGMASNGMLLSAEKDASSTCSCSMTACPPARSFAERPHPCTFPGRLARRAFPFSRGVRNIFCARPSSPS